LRPAPDGRKPNHRHARIWGMSVQMLEHISARLGIEHEAVDAEARDGE
jgi:hypothetical protein